MARITAYRRPLLGTGLCGALTTFSTFQLELLRMLDHGYLAMAGAYCVASVATGFAAVAGFSPMPCSTSTSATRCEPACCCAASSGSAGVASCTPTGC